MTTTTYDMSGACDRDDCTTLECPGCEPTVTDLAAMPESARPAAIAAMTDDDAMAAAKLLRSKLNEANDARAPFMTKSGNVRANLSLAAATKLWVIDRNRGIYQSCLDLLEPRLKLAYERRAHQHVQQYSKERVVSQLRDIQVALGRLSESIDRGLEGEPTSYTRLVSDIQHEVLWGLANMGLDRLVINAAKADGNTDF